MASLTADLTGSDPEEDTLFPEEAPAQRACISRRGIAMGVAGVFAFALVVYVACTPHPQKQEASAHTEDVMEANWNPATHPATRANLIMGNYPNAMVLVCPWLKKTELSLMQKNLIDNVANTVVGKATDCTSTFEGSACKENTLVATMTKTEVMNIQSDITKKSRELAMADIVTFVAGDNSLTGAARTTAENALTKEVQVKLEMAISESLKGFNRPIANKMQVKVSGKISTWDSWEEVTSWISTPIAEGYQIALNTC